MAVFPEINPMFYNDGDQDVRARMERAYDSSISILGSYWQESDFDYRFYAGDQNAFMDMGYGQFPVNRRKPFYFNRIKPIVSMITGHQRKNRKSTVVIPIENADEETADQFTKILMWCDQQEGIGETISDAFEGACISGMNLLQVWVDYRSDPISGNIKVDNCAYNSFLIDPFFRKQDLSDCNFVWKRSFLTRADALALLPEKQDLIEHLHVLYGRDNKFQYMPENLGLSQQHLIIYDEFYYKTYRTQQLLCDTQTGETIEWKNQHEEEKLEQFLNQYPQVQLIETQIPTYNVSIMLNGVVAYDGPQSNGIDRLPFVPVFAYYNSAQTNFVYRVQGVVRGLRDVQYLYNRQRIIQLDMIESQINSGWKYKVDALVNPKDVFLQGQGKGLAIKRDANMDDVQQIIPPGIPPSMIALADSMSQEIQLISGVNEELLGSAQDDKAGILSMLRQGAALTTLQGLFDQLDRSQKLLGTLIMDIIQANFTPGKVQRIVKGQAQPQFYNKAFGKYDCAIEEGFNTTTQRQMEFAQLLHLKEVGVQIPDSRIIESCTLQDKKALVDEIKSIQQQQQQMQQMQLQAGMSEQQARTQLAQSRAIADQGLGLERISRIQENKALAIERKAAAVRDENVALLNLVKALKEIDTIDLEHIEKLVGMQQMIKQEERESEQEATKPQPTNKE